MAEGRSILRAAALALLLGTAASPLAAQHVRLEGRGDPELHGRLRALLAIPDLHLLSADTLIPAGDTLRGTVVVLGSRLLFEGTVTGHLLGLDANVFLRPGSTIGGDLLNVAGGLYASALARVEGRVIDRPLAPYRLRQVEGGWVLEGTAEADSPLRLEGFHGLTPPTYDRVNGVSLRGGGAWLAPPLGALYPRVSAHGVYRSARGEIEGGAEAAVVRGRWTLTLGAERATVTNEAWVRSALKNSLAFAFKGSDYRNYHRSDRLYARLERETVARAWRLTPWLALQREDVASLRAGDPWVVLAPDSVRPNPPVDDGWIRSLRAGVDGRWASPRAAFEGELELEAGGPEEGGEGFVRYVLGGDWEMEALFGHTLEMEWRFLGPLPGSGPAPPRRWSFVGDVGTLRTFDTIFRGDRLVWVETEYGVPLPRRWRVPVLGVPELELIHEIGMAWTEGEDRELEQNVGARVNLFAFFVRGLVDPDAPGDVKVDLGLTWPF